MTPTRTNSVELAAKGVALNIGTCMVPGCGSRATRMVEAIRVGLRSCTFTCTPHVPDGEAKALLMLSGMIEAQLSELRAERERS